MNETRLISKKILRAQVRGMQTSSCKLGVGRENWFRERVLPFVINGPLKLIILYK